MSQSDQQDQLIAALQAFTNQHDSLYARKIASIKSRINEKLNQQQQLSNHAIHVIAVDHYNQKMLNATSNISHLAKEWTDKLVSIRLNNDQFKNKTSTLVQQINTNRSQVQSIRQESWDQLMNALLGPQVTAKQEQTIEHIMSMRAQEMAKQYATTTVHHPVMRARRLLDIMLTVETNTTENV